MASYTEDDLKAAEKFADSNHKIRLIQRLHKKVPHLTSWVKYKIRAASHDDYYVPFVLQQSAKVVTVEIGEKLCSLLSCNPIKEQDVCKPSDTASYYHVGDDAYDVQCQPACFNTSPQATYNEDGSRAADMYMLNWHGNSCRIVNSSLVSWLEKTNYRSETKYETRLNDMPTGFSRDISTNPFGSGFDYRTNKAYCNYYDRHLEKDGSCAMSTWEFLLDALVGMQLINTIKSAIRQLNTNKPFDMPDNLPELPLILDKIHTVAGWKNNINSDFIVPDLIDTKPQQATKATAATQNTNDDSIHHFRQRAEIRNENLSGFMRHQSGIKSEKLPQSSSRKKRSINKTKTLIDDDNDGGGDNDDDDDGDKPNKEWYEKIDEMFISLLEMFTEEDVWLQFGIDHVTSVALSKIKSLCVKTVEKLSGYLAKGLFDVAGAIGQKVLVSGIKSVTMKIVTSMALRIGAKAAIMLAKLVGAVASIIGWILVGTMILDLMFSFWDPFGYNNLFPPEMPKTVSDQGELALRQALEAATADFTFDHFAAKILNEEEMIDLQLESLVDRLVYLDALVVNSEGSRIDKGDEFDISRGTQNDMDYAKQSGLAKRVRFDEKTYKTFNRKFMLRTEVNRYLNYATTTSLLASVAFYAVSMPIVCIFFLICALIIMAFARLELQDDLLVELLAKYKFVHSNDSNDYTGYDPL